MSVTEKRSASKSSERYTDADWDEESYALFVEMADPHPCPSCGRTGFFGPRAADPGRKYRACRFCGFYQEVGGEPVQYRSVVHNCKEWPECGRAPYVWWVHPDEKVFTCPFCGQEVGVEGRNVFAKGAAVQRPSEDSIHPWRRVPQNRPYAYYQRFWENWGCTKGRVFL